MPGLRKFLVAAVLGAAAMALVGGLGFASTSLLGNSSAATMTTTSDPLADCIAQYQNDPSGVDPVAFCQWLLSRNPPQTTTTVTPGPTTTVTISVGYPVPGPVVTAHDTSTVTQTVTAPPVTSTITNTVTTEKVIVKTKVKKVCPPKPKGKRNG